MANQERVETSVSKDVKITAPKLRTAIFTIVGLVPYVQHAFSQKAREQIKKKQEGGSQANTKRARQPKDFEANFVASQHRSADGWIGIPAGAFRAAMVSACRLVQFKMTMAKLSVFIIADGYDVVDQTPLIRITKGKPRHVEHLVRNETGVVDIRARAMFDPGWEATLKVQFDEDQFSLTDITNLLHRVGQQVGIGEGRPDSPKSTGMGWGLFDIAANK